MLFKDIAVAYAVLAGICAATTSDNSLICPDMDITNCYPKSFVPTKQWQIIKPGQVVPEGLHYKVDFETGIKQAKIMEDNAQQHPQLQNQAAVAVVESSQANDDVGASYDNSGHENKPVNVVKQRIQETVAGEGPQFNNALNDLQSLFGTSDNNVNIETVINNNLHLIDQSLDTLIYSSHDIKYGEQITADNKNIVIFFSIINSGAQQVQVKEKLLRIVSSSIRNNDQALSNIISNNGGQLFENLLQFIDKQLVTQNFDNQILVKRAIGILNALIYNPQGLLSFESLRCKDYLNSRFHLLNSDVKERCVNLLNDVDMLVADRGSTVSDEL